MEVGLLTPDLARRMAAYIRETPQEEREDWTYNVYSRSDLP